MNERFVRVDELAEHLNVSVPTVHGWQRHRGLPCLKVGRRCTLYIITEVEQWLRKQAGEEGDPAPSGRPERPRRGDEKPESTP